jgi:hypothetical protein
MVALLSDMPKNSSVLLEIFSQILRLKGLKVEKKKGM